MTPAAPASDPRFFSLDEANRTLPLVRRIVEDILDHHRKLEPAMSRYRRLSSTERETEPGRRLKRELESAMAGLDALVGELRELGCLFKGFSDGLVDWYSYYAGRPVFLCWKLGEPEIGHWHQLDAGFIGRQPILPGQERAFRSTPA